MNSRTGSVAGVVIVTVLICGRSFADGPIVDKVYNPYVQPLERELEYRFVVQNDNANDAVDGTQVHRLGIARSWTDRWFTEVYLIGNRTNDDSLSVDAYEFEAKWQLTEQGEYWADWGLLFELGVPRGAEIGESAVTALISKEWGRWVTTVNTELKYEWGEGITNEWDTALAVQGRYRLSRGFEPALEFYAGQNTRALGPVFVGDILTGGRTKLHWEAGVIFGIDGTTADQTFRGLLEFEF